MGINVICIYLDRILKLFCPFLSVKRNKIMRIMSSTEFYERLSVVGTFRKSSK